ncbi:hypothetical protein Goari_011374, partial [Gossypium aridum]|nr:hypothetical protein [Gossypium aridum]
FLNKFLDNKLKGFLIDDININDNDTFDDSDTIDRDLDTELELLTMMVTHITRGKPLLFEAALSGGYQKTAITSNLID